MPSNSTSRRRHSKQHSTSSSSSRKPPPSVISTASLDSASSNTTVKGYSIFPSSLRPSKRPGAKNEQTERPGLHYERSKSVDDSCKENVDVFAYLMEEGGEDEDEDEDDKYTSGAREEKAAEEHAVAAQAELSSSSSSSGLADRPPMSPRYSDLEVRAIDSVQRSWGRGSLHSDSGISIRSSSPDQDSPTMHHKLPTVFDEPNTETDAHDNHHMGGYGLEISEDSVDPCLAFGHENWPSLETSHMSSPEAYYTPAPPRLTQASHTALSPVPADQIVKHASHLERRPAKISKRGYDFLASNIDSRDDALLKPIYRKFEMLNNRMLLYLQDEIAEMEDQLRDLDQAIAHEEQSNGARSASRRMEARLPSQLHWHRVDLLNRSFAKVEQYSTWPLMLFKNGIANGFTCRSCSYLLQQADSKPRTRLPRCCRRLSQLDHQKRSNRRARDCLPPAPIRPPQHLC